MKKKVAFTGASHMILELLLSVAIALGVPGCWSGAITQPTGTGEAGATSTEPCPDPAPAPSRCAEIISDTASWTTIVELSDPKAKLPGCDQLAHRIGNIWICSWQWCTVEPFDGGCPVCP